MIIIEQKNLFTKNFLLVMIGTILSAIGGIGLNTAMGIMVFEQTKSTALFGIFTALALLPQIVVPIVMGPVVDRNNPLKLLLKNEIILVFVYFGFAFISYKYGFNYYSSTIFSIIISGLGNISNLCGNSITPQIMERGNYIRGNSIMSTIYPLCSIFVVPLAFFLFNRFGITMILIAYGILTIFDILIESNIDHKFIHKETKGFGVKEFFNDFKEGFSYFINDPGVKNVFFYFVFSNLASSTVILIYPFFANHPNLSIYNYGILMGVRSAGYLMGGLLHYFVNITKDNRFKIAVFVYMSFCVLDAVLLRLPFVLMCSTVFLLGIGGMNSANIRISAIAVHVPSDYRAKVNSFSVILMALSNMVGELLSGLLAEFIPIPTIFLFAQILPLTALCIFILPKKNKVKELYNYSLFPS